ncbi:DUF58 domain-containing protein [Ideonella sp. BN130291]|uniref:DUF58 domain-containing protein n=1 Tax=Ideonella sp. BN130291 TaxID=3112940 RepID=UPI002E259C9B|nr:DUF58 domain-containing protein [Ideonella sp. BN130291]
MKLLPTRATVLALAALATGAAAALLAGVPLATVQAVAAAVSAAGLALGALDLGVSLLAWRRHPLQLTRRLPAALAVGVERRLQLQLANPGRLPWRVALFDHVDAAISTEGLPASVNVPGGQRATLSYRATPHRRGPVGFAPAELRVRTLAGCFELGLRLGAAQSLRVYPNFAAVARYAWLAGDHRLSEIGIKTYKQRGGGTDFKQLSDYSPGDSVRHIDWRASLRHRRPIVRQFQDERDQRVLFVLDCGRRMRADDTAAAAVGHFDQALNALMLLAYVALKAGDEVGALTFAAPPAAQRHFAPRKGLPTLDALTSRLYDIQPTLAHPDYLQMATEVMRLQRKRALVVVLTNFRDEDAPELAPALKLLRTRHLVMLASLRETALGHIAGQPLRAPEDASEAATAHLFEQARRDAFHRLAGRDALLVDVEPAGLAAELVNRYHAVKRSGLL